MKSKISISALMIIIAIHVNAQTGRIVTGIVKDSTGNTLTGITVKLYQGPDSIAVRTDSTGIYLFKNVSGRFRLVFSSAGYQAFENWYSTEPGVNSTTIPPIVLSPSYQMLTTVTITGVEAVKLKEDTIEYNAAAFKVSEGSVVEEAIKKMPGLEVDAKGNITAQGKKVNKVRLNGKEYMAGDVTSLTRNLPANMVQNIQLIDDYGDQAK